MPTKDVDTIGNRLPSQSERNAANQLRQVLSEQTNSDAKPGLTITGATGDSTEVVLTPSLSRLLSDLLSHIGNGDTVNLLPVAQVLTTQQAADVLNVSHSYFSGLLHTGAISHELIGRHRRVKAKDVFEYKNARDAQRASALDNLAKIDKDLV